MTADRATIAERLREVVLVLAGIAQDVEHLGRPAPLEHTVRLVLGGADHWEDPTRPGQYTVCGYAIHPAAQRDRCALGDIDCGRCGRSTLYRLGE